MVAGRYKKERKRETITQPNGTTHLQHAIVGDKHAATSAASSMLQVGQEVSGIGPWLLDELHRDVMLHSLNDWDIYIYMYITSHKSCTTCIYHHLLMFTPYFQVSQRRSRIFFLDVRLEFLVIG